MSNGKEILWKKRFEALVSAYRDVEVYASEIKDKTWSERQFGQPKRIYVSFDLDVSDSKEYAEENWPAYDVYDLNPALSEPFEEEEE